MQLKFDYKDVSIVPEPISDIYSRSQVSPFFEKGTMLPIMTAPMDTVVDVKNIEEFLGRRIQVCLPRGKKNLHIDGVFQSIGLDDAKIISKITYQKDHNCYCIDIANGHMSILLDIVRDFKKNHPEAKLIIGNIANPETYRIFAQEGVWGIRVGIGAGSGCLTSSNTAVYYPYGSLVKECYEIKKQSGFETKIIADGGIKSYNDIITALALGADIVMVGSLFNKTIQSCTKAFAWKMIPVPQSLINWLMKKGVPVYKKFRGMSTKEVQRAWGRKELKTAEGIVKWNKVEIDLNKWVPNFIDYLKSSMSYTGSYELDQFKDCQKVLNTQNAINRHNI